MLPFVRKSVDVPAIPTFVEVKRSTDTRIRREVVAQMLDYAAHSVQYWPIELIRESYENNASETNSLASIGITPDSEDAFWKSVNLNLRAGRIRLIFVADSIPSALQRIIEYLNGQMIDTEVLGLEIKQFLSSDGLTTLVPHLIGNTASATQTKRSETKKWDEESFLAQAAQISGSEAAALCEKLLRSFESLGCRIWWGEGKTGGSFVPVYDGTQKHQICSVNTWYKNTFVGLYFQYMKSPFNELEYRKKLKTALELIPGVEIPDARLNKQPKFPVSCLDADENYTLFINAMRTYIEDIKAYEANSGAKQAKP